MIIDGIVSVNRFFLTAIPRMGSQRNKQKRRYGSRITQPRFSESANQAEECSSCQKEIRRLLRNSERDRSEQEGRNLRQGQQDRTDNSQLQNGIDVGRVSFADHPLLGDSDFVNVSWCPERSIPVTLPRPGLDVDRQILLERQSPGQGRSGLFASSQQQDLLILRDWIKARNEEEKSDTRYKPKPDQHTDYDVAFGLRNQPYHAQCDGNGACCTSAFGQDKEQKQYTKDKIKRRFELWFNLRHRERGEATYRQIGALVVGVNGPGESIVANVWTKGAIKHLCRNPQHQISSG